ncbi:unnamed protein product, partial [Musa acuminata subsp. burmannicoides]
AKRRHLLFRPLSRRVFLTDHSYRSGFLVRDHIGAVDLRFRSFEVLFVPLLCTSSSSTNSERVLCESRSLFSLVMRHGNGKFGESCVLLDLALMNEPTGSQYGQVIVVSDNNSESQLDDASYSF